MLEALQVRLEGKTAKQKNPHPGHSIAWLAWIIARLGGWTGTLRASAGSDHRCEEAGIASNKWPKDGTSENVCTP